MLPELEGLDELDGLLEEPMLLLPDDDGEEGDEDEPLAALPLFLPY